MRLAVVGDPVAQSRSPELFQALMSQAERAGSYEAIRVAAGEGERTFEALRARGFTGLNVTTPLKEEAFRRADTRDDVAQAAASVNLLVLGVHIAGYNTDGAGALGALAAAGARSLSNARILVLGAGPTARAAIVALRAMQARVDIWNRTPERAEVVVRTLGPRPFQSGIVYDAIVSTLLPGVTPADVGRDVAHAIARAPIVIDANYGPRATLAEKFENPQIVDGYEMLRASARASFEIFSRAEFTG